MVKYTQKDWNKAVEDFSASMNEIRQEMRNDSSTPRQKSASNPTSKGDHSTGDLAKSFLAAIKQARADEVRETELARTAGVRGLLNLAFGDLFSKKQAQESGKSASDENNWMIPNFALGKKGKK